MENTEKVLEAMKKAGKAIKAGEIAEIAGMDKKDVDKAMKILKTEEKIVSPKLTKVSSGTGMRTKSISNGEIANSPISVVIVPFIRASTPSPTKVISGV